MPWPYAAAKLFAHPHGGHPEAATTRAAGQVRARRASVVPDLAALAEHGRMRYPEQQGPA